MYRIVDRTDQSPLLVKKVDCKTGDDGWWDFDPARESQRDASVKDQLDIWRSYPHPHIMRLLRVIEEDRVYSEHITTGGLYRQLSNPSR